MSRRWCPILVGAGLSAVLVSARTSKTAPKSTADPTGALASAPPAQPPAQLTSAQVDAAVGKLGWVVQDAMGKTGVPGVAVAVVYKDKVIYSKGFGVRQVGKPETVDADTVFQIASLSKPISSTLVAGVVGTKAVAWDDPVVKHDPGFALQDPWVSAHVTLADMFAHRSGLPGEAGDPLQVLGYDRAYILGHLRYEPLSPFRATYAYCNFGLTSAAEAVAKAKGTSWEDLSTQVLYQPLGMTSTSSRYADYEKAANKAALHVKADGTWQAKYTWNPEVASPGGGVSSTVKDLTQWMRLQLGNGTIDGKQVIDAAALAQTHLPQIVSRPPQSPAGQAGFYGLGWNVNYDDHGRLRLDHSGTFPFGAATDATLLPSEQLGIVVLTNGQAIGLAEAISATFFDLAQNGHPTVAWLDYIGGFFGQPPDRYAQPPANPAPANPAQTYVGTYANDYYGPLTVTAQGENLTLTLGPKNLQFPLRHHDGDTFSTAPGVGIGSTGVTFTAAPGGIASKVWFESLDYSGQGTFSRR